MASSPVPRVVAPSRSGQEPTGLVRLLVDRRVTISLVLFTLAVAVDLILGGQPRDLARISEPAVWLSELAILLGLLIRTWAAGTLRKQQKLATNGPYAWVRNPLYVGSFLMMIGFCVLVLSPWLMPVVALPIAIMYTLAVRDEERILARLFPRDWPEYAQRVPRFLPLPTTLPALSEWSLAQWKLNGEYQAWIGAAVGLVALWLRY